MLESRALTRAVIDGAVAQLGERRVRNAKVEGSIPFRSTINSADRRFRSFSHCGGMLHIHLDGALGEQ
jgi:hypothetical protein